MRLSLFNFVGETDAFLAQTLKWGCGCDTEEGRTATPTTTHISNTSFQSSIRWLLPSMLTSVTLSPDEAAATGGGGGGGLRPDGETTKANSSGVSSGSGIDVSITFGCAAKKCETAAKRTNELNSSLHIRISRHCRCQVLTYSLKIFKAAEIQSISFGPVQKVHFGSVQCTSIDCWWWFAIQDS